MRTLWCLQQGGTSKPIQPCSANFISLLQTYCAKCLLNLQMHGSIQPMTAGCAAGLSVGTASPFIWHNMLHTHHEPFFLHIVMLLHFTPTFTHTWLLLCCCRAPGSHGKSAYKTVKPGVVNDIDIAPKRSFTTCTAQYQRNMHNMAIVPCIGNISLHVALCQSSFCR